MNSKDTNVCPRLGEERKRLHLSQSKVAEYCNVSVKTIGRWEKNIPIPSNKLAMLLDLGYDLSYILTGIKLAPQIAGLEAASNVWKATANKETVPHTNEPVSSEQRIWLDLLEDLTDGDSKRLQQIGLALVGYSQAKDGK